MREKSWEVGYPKGLMKTIDAFREKYFQYEDLDLALRNYIERNKKSGGKRILSLGSGTGRHEVQLAKLGYEVIGIERNEESIQLAKEYIEKSGVDVKLIKCDFLDKKDLQFKLSNLGEFDIIALLLIPISVYDHSLAIKNTQQFLKQGGIFVTDIFGYEENFNFEKFSMESNIEVAESSEGQNYGVRMNYYEYKGHIVDWDAIYLYYENGELKMNRDYDILDVIPDDRLDASIEVDLEKFAPLPIHKITEVNEAINPPHLVDYFVGWRKK